MQPKPQYPQEQTSDGEFRRQESRFRRRCGLGDDCDHEPEPGRYHLYVSYACPWAHRTIIFRKLKRLEDVISMTVVDPIRDERGWAFRDGPGHSTDPVNGFEFLSEAYLIGEPGFQFIGELSRQFRRGRIPHDVGDKRVPMSTCRIRAASFASRSKRVICSSSAS